MSFTATQIIYMVPDRQTNQSPDNSQCGRWTDLDQIDEYMSKCNMHYRYLLKYILKSGENMVKIQILFRSTILSLIVS